MGEFLRYEKTHQACLRAGSLYFSDAARGDGICKPVRHDHIAEGDGGYLGEAHARQHRAKQRFLDAEGVQHARRKGVRLSAKMCALRFSSGRIE